MPYFRSIKINPWFGDDFNNLKSAFAKRGVKLETPSKDGFLRRLSLPDGEQIFFTADALPLNSAAARSLAYDKLATYQVLNKYGIAVPEGVAFFATEFQQRETKVEPHMLFGNLPKVIHRYFANIGDKDFTVIVKPGQGSRGYMLSTCTTLFEIMLCAERILTQCHYGLIQNYVEGPEYRVVILDGEALLVYKKEISPFERERLNKKKNARQPGMKINDPVRGDTGKFIPTAKAPPEIISTAKKANLVLGLRYSGVDVCLSRNKSPATILEVNSNPGYDALEKDRRFDAQIIADRLASAVLGSRAKMITAC